MSTEETPVTETEEQTTETVETPQATETVETTTAETVVHEPKEKTLTQAQVNKLLAEEKRRINEKYADYETLKTERDELKSTSAAKEAEALRLKVAYEKKIPAELIDRLRGETEEELLADADTLVSVVRAEYQGPGFDGGTRQPANDQDAYAKAMRNVFGR